MNHFPIPTIPLLPPAKLAYGGGEAHAPLQAFVQRCSRDVAGTNVGAGCGCGAQARLTMQEMSVMEPSVSINYQVTSTRLACEIRRMLRR
jgi:hypothetical protein